MPADLRPPLTHTLSFWRSRVVVLCEDAPALRARLTVVSQRCEMTAEQLGLSADEVDVAAAAGLLHDIGKAPKLTVTGWHPLDGAMYLQRCGEHRLARLVAHHTSSYYEAMLVGHDRELEDFPAERSLVADILAVCDMTTLPDGTPCTITEHRSLLRERYGEQAPQVRALDAYWPDLLDSSDRLKWRRTQNSKR